MTYKTITRIKAGSKEDGFEYIEVGETVSADDLDGGEEELDNLLAAKVLVDAKDFDRIRPELVEGANQPKGTPSNMAQIEGTTLQQAAKQDEAAIPEELLAVNPADPPEVKNSGTGKGFDTKPAEPEKK